MNSVNQQPEFQPDEGHLHRAPLIPVPRWGYKMLRATSCPHCHAHFGKRDVLAIGLRRTHRVAAAMFVEVECRRCRKLSVVLFQSRPMDAVGAARALHKAAAEVCEQDHAIDRACVKRWQDIDANAARAAPHFFQTHDQFMAAIGLTPQQVEEFGTYRKSPPSEEGQDKKEF